MFLKLKIAYIVQERQHPIWSMPSNFSYKISNEKDNILLLNTIDASIPLNTWISRVEKHQTVTWDLIGIERIIENFQYGDYYFECKNEYVALVLAETMRKFLGENTNQILTTLKEAEASILSFLRKERRLLCAIGLTKLSLFNTTTFPDHVIQDISEYVCDDERVEQAKDDKKLALIEKNKQTFFNSVRKLYPKDMSQEKIKELEVKLKSTFTL